MKKNGFTLVELLAVTVILAVLALITTVIVSDIINSARKKAFETSTMSIYEAIELDCAENGYTTSQSYTISGNNITNTTANPNYTFTYNGKVNNATGSAVVSYNSTTGNLSIVMELEGSGYCAKNSSNNGKNNFVVTEGDC